jgi:hypothetical protein
MFYIKTIPIPTTAIIMLTWLEFMGVKRTIDRTLDRRCNMQLSWLSSKSGGLVYGGFKMFLFLCILRGIELHFVHNGDLISVSVSYRYERIFTNNKFHRGIGNQTDSINQSEINQFDFETCFSAQNGTCKIVPCVQTEALNLLVTSSNFRGAVREVDSDTYSPDPVCGVCRAYGAQCAVSIAHNFTYIHVMKSGGSSMHLFLKSAFCRLPDSSSPRMFPPSSRDYECEPQVFKLMDCNTAIRKHPNFFRWSVVRHPIPRAVSGWAMASRRPADGAGPVDFNTWAVNTSSLPTRVWAMHWQPQVDFLLDQRGCPMYNYVAVMGRGLAADMEVVLRRVNAPALWAAYRRAGLPREYASADAVREAAYRNLSAAATAALAERYRADLDRFGFRMADWREDGFF